VNNNDVTALVQISALWFLWCFDAVGWTTGKTFSPSKQPAVGGKLLELSTPSTVASRAFPDATAQAWNSLPEATVSLSSLQTFCCHLKTLLFRLSYPHPILDCQTGITTMVLVPHVLFRKN